MDNYTEREKLDETGDEQGQVLAFAEDEGGRRDKDIIMTNASTKPMALAKYMMERWGEKPGPLWIQAIGPVAISRAIYGILNAIEKTSSWSSETELVIRPEWKMLEMPDGQMRTGVRFRVFPIKKEAMGGN